MAYTILKCFLEGSESDFLIKELESKVSELLRAHQHQSIFLLELRGEIDGRSKGYWTIGLHFDDDDAPGGVHHEVISSGPDKGVTLEEMKALEVWMRDLNKRLNCRKPPEINHYVSY